MTGNTGLDPNVNFLGTADNQALVLKVNNQRALRFDYALSIWNPTTGDYYEGVNVLGYSSGELWLLLPLANRLFLQTQFGRNQSTQLPFGQSHCGLLFLIRPLPPACCQ